MADEKKTTKKAKQAEETPEAVSEETVEETPGADDAPVEEPVVEEPAAEEPPTEETPAEAPAAEEEPAVEEPAAAAEPAAEAAEATPAPQSVPKPKRKRPPRSQRHKHSKPKRERPAERRGVVVSSAMDKTIVVKVDTVKAHPRYKKVVRRSSKFHAHDEQNAAKVGDLVRIVETRPLSKTKNWRLAEVLEEAK